jgi:hypothetical protein
MNRILAAAAAAVALGFAGNAYAFHSGGVAECEGCHTMHNSFENAVITSNTSTGLVQFAAGPYLLKGSDQSSACLNCHQHTGDTVPSSYHISTAEVDMTANGGLPIERTPGGDFAWLKKSYSFSNHGETTTVPGERHGHNIVATDYNYVADSAMGATAPGGTYPVARLACSSCHDPHGKTRRDNTTTGVIIASGSYPKSVDTQYSYGKLGAYRILRGPLVPELSTGTTFTNNVPVALAPSTYNRSESTSETVVAYGTGMSEWCANCHPSLLMQGYVEGAEHQRHPAGNTNKFPANYATNYNNYVASGAFAGALVNGNGHVGYSTLAPFETGATDANLLQNGTGTAVLKPSADTSSSPMCLSCHRAHATGFESMLRFGVAAEFVTKGDAAGVPAYNPEPAGGMQVADLQAAYYDRPATYFAPFQRVYCNKCHMKD